MDFIKVTLDLFEGFGISLLIFFHIDSAPFKSLSKTFIEFKAPIEVALIQLTCFKILYSFNAFNTPIWYAPLAPPPPKTKPILFFIVKH